MLILPTDSTRLRDPVAAASCLPRVWRRGAPPFAVIVRERDRARRAALAAALRPVCRARNIRLLIANDAALAARIGADGVHFSEAALRRYAVGKRTGGKRGRHIVTAAAHSYSALVRASRLGADAVLLSPVFATASHPEARPFGAVRFAACVHKLRGDRAVPIIALGGVSAVNVARVARAGANGFAAIGALS